MLWRDYANNLWCHDAKKRWGERAEIEAPPPAGNVGRPPNRLRSCRRPCDRPGTEKEGFEPSMEEFTPITP